MLKAIPAHLYFVWKVSAIGQPTRPMQPSIPPGSISK